ALKAIRILEPQKESNLASFIGVFNVLGGVGDHRQIGILADEITPSSKLIKRLYRIFPVATIYSYGGNLGSNEPFEASSVKKAALKCIDQHRSGSKNGFVEAQPIPGYQRFDFLIVEARAQQSPLEDAKLFQILA